MAQDYKTDEEQVEELKKWWKENGQGTVVAIIVGVGLVFGWQGWQKQQQDEIYAASAVYQNMLQSVNRQGGDVKENIASAVYLADTLISDFPNTTYADFAALFKAKFALEEGNYAEAEQQLRWVLDNGATDEVSIQARLRLARVHVAQSQYDQALELLSIDAKGFSVAYEELKGDIYNLQGQPEKALDAYVALQENLADSEVPVNDALLKIKIDQLKSELGAGVIATPQAAALPEENL